MEPDHNRIRTQSATTICLFALVVIICFRKVDNQTEITLINLPEEFPNFSQLTENAFSFLHICHYRCQVQQSALVRKKITFAQNINFEHFNINFSYTVCWFGDAGREEKEKNVINQGKGPLDLLFFNCVFVNCMFSMRA